MITVNESMDKVKLYTMHMELVKCLDYINDVATLKWTKEFLEAVVCNNEAPSNIVANWLSICQKTGRKNVMRMFLAKSILKLRQILQVLEEAEEDSPEFCTCKKQDRRVYTDKCLNCNLPIEGVNSVNSNQEVHPTLGHVPTYSEGYRAGYQAAIGEAISMQHVDTILSEKDCTCENQDKRLQVAKDEILGILRRRRVASGPKYWSHLVHVRMDYDNRKNRNGCFLPALIMLHEEGTVELKEGFNRLRLESAHA